MQDRLVYEVDAGSSMLDTGCLMLDIHYSMLDGDNSYFTVLSAILP